jgi:hypothetical protein
VTFGGVANLYFAGVEMTASTTTGVTGAKSLA